MSVSPLKMVNRVEMPSTMPSRAPMGRMDSTCPSSLTAWSTSAGISMSRPSGAGDGAVTALPWGMGQFGVRRHAVHLYEVLVGVAALVAWWAVSDLTGLGRPVRSYRAGRPFLVAAAVYAAGRLFVDAFKETTPLVGGGFHLVQLVSLVVLVVALFVLARISTMKAKGKPLTGI